MVLSNRVARKRPRPMGTPAMDFESYVYTQKRARSLISMSHGINERGLRFDLTHVSWWHALSARIRCEQFWTNAPNDRLRRLAVASTRKMSAVISADLCPVSLCCTPTILLDLVRQIPKTNSSADTCGYIQAVFWGLCIFTTQAKTTNSEFGGQIQ